MDAATFARKWRNASLSERSASQQHFPGAIGFVIDAPSSAPTTPAAQTG